MKCLVKLLSWRVKSTSPRQQGGKGSLLTHWFISFAKQRHHEMLHPQQHIKYVQKWNCSWRVPWTLSLWCVHFSRPRGKKQNKTKQPVERSLYEIKLPVPRCCEALWVAAASEDCLLLPASFHWFIPSASPAQPRVRICHWEQKWGEQFQLALRPLIWSLAVKRYRIAFLLELVETQGCFSTYYQMAVGPLSRKLREQLEPRVSVP